MRKPTCPRTRSRPSDCRVASVTARPARAPRANGTVRPKNVPAPADGRERRCASPGDRSAHRRPVSFPRFSTAPSRGTGCRPTRLRRVAPLPALAAVSRPPLRDARPASTTKSALPGSKGGGELKCLQGWSVNPGTRFQSKYYGIGGDRVSMGRPSGFRAGQPHPGFGGADGNRARRIVPRVVRLASWGSGRPRCRRQPHRKESIP